MKRAGQPPSEGCVAVSKQEYDSANRQRTRFSAYARTGQLGRPVLPLWAGEV